MAKNTIAAARVMKEIRTISQSKELRDEGTTLESVDGSLNELIGTIRGPSDSPYEGGTYQLRVQVPSTYPFDAPKINFITKVWHPNISSVTGAICLDVLGSNWAASMTIQASLISIQCLLGQADPGNPQDAVVGAQLLVDADMYKETAKFWAIEYASAVGTRSVEMEGKVNKLVDIGFARDEAVRALSTNRWELEESVSKLSAEMADGK